MKNCTLLVSSCDKYEDAWFPYFSLLKKYWPEVADYPIVLSTETKTFSMDGLDIRSYNSKEGSWSKRFRLCLESIDTEFVIVSLEDFFLQKKVANQEVLRCIEWMNQDPLIAAFYFKRVSDSYCKCQYENYYEATPDLKYRVNLQLGLWRRSHLLKCLNDEENAWEFELMGCERLKDSPLKFYCHKASDDSHRNVDGPFPYLFRRHTGYGIVQGKWMWNNKKLFWRNGIFNVNMKRLGVHHKYTFNIGFVAHVFNFIAPPLVKLRDKLRACLLNN